MQIILLIRKNFYSAMRHTVAWYVYAFEISCALGKLGEAKRWKVCNEPKNFTVYCHVYEIRITNKCLICYGEDKKVFGRIEIHQHLLIFLGFVAATAFIDSRRVFFLL